MSQPIDPIDETPDELDEADEFNAIAGTDVRKPLSLIERVRAAINALEDQNQWYVVELEDEDFIE